MFQGFTSETFEFYMAIRFNNNREFLQANQEWYQSAVRKPLVELCQALAPTVEAIDPQLDTRPGRCVALDQPGHPVRPGQVPLPGPQLHEIPAAGGGPGSDLGLLL